MQKGTSVAMQIFGRMVAAPTGDISLPGFMCKVSTPGLSASSSPAGGMQSTRAHVPVGCRERSRHVGGLWSSEASMGSCPSQDQSEPGRVGCGCANSWWDAFLVIPSLVCCQRGFAAVPSGSEGFSRYPVTLGTGDLTGSAGFALQRLKPLFSCLCVSPANFEPEGKLLSN